MDPLPWHHDLTFFGSYVDARSDLSAASTNFNQFSQHGTSYQMSTRYDVPLPSPNQYVHHDFALGFDFKVSDNNLLFGGDTVTKSSPDIAQFVATYNALRRDPYGHDPARDLVLGRFDIPEPRPSCRSSTPPRSTWSSCRARSSTPKAAAWGTAAASTTPTWAACAPTRRASPSPTRLQLVERVPREPHDLCVDTIVTEERTIATGCRAADQQT